MTDIIRKRIFIVGCSRSGTTVLQSCFARHPEIFTFPETALLIKALGRRAWSRPLSWAGISSGKEWLAVKNILDAHGRTQRPNSKFHSLRNSLRRICSELDGITLEQNKSIWLEKTPRHFYRADAISNYIPDSHVIHIIRDGSSVVASIFDRAKKYPEHFARQARPGYAVRQWNSAIKRHTDLLGTPSHSFLLFEEFTASPEAQLRRLCTEAKIEFNSQMLESSTDDAQHINKEEHWKAGSTGTIEPPIDKFSSLFTEKERKQILKKLDWVRHSEIKAYLKESIA